MEMKEVRGGFASKCISQNINEKQKRCMPRSSYYISRVNEDGLRVSITHYFERWLLTDPCIVCPRRTKENIMRSLL